MVIVQVLNRERELAAHEDLVVLSDHEREVFTAAHLCDLELTEMFGRRWILPGLFVPNAQLAEAVGSPDVHGAVAGDGSRVLVATGEELDL